MFRINIILMLSTIIPLLDCCSSSTIFNRKSMHLYPAAGLELSLHKPMQLLENHHNHHQTTLTSTSPPPESLPVHPTPQLQPSSGHENDQDNLWHKHHLDLKKNIEESYELHLKLNKSLKLDTEKQDEHQEQKLAEVNYVFSPMEEASSTTTQPQPKPQPQNQSEVDAQYQLISDIVSLECVDILKLEFCLNGGRCFLYPILNHSLSSCECAEGFVGERCEAKSYEFIPRIRPRLVLAKTKGGPLIYGLAFMDILFLLFLFCKNYNRD